MNVPSKPPIRSLAVKATPSSTASAPSKVITSPETAEEVESTKPSNFLRFPHLPVEIRLLIWKEVCSRKRNIDVRTGVVGDVAFLAIFGAAPLSLFGYTSKTPPPAVLHVNQESQLEALKYYQLDFGTEMKRFGCSFTTQPSIYVNWKVDRICLIDHQYGEAQLWDLAMCFKSNGLKSLAINFARHLGDSYRTGPFQPSSDIAKKVLAILPAGLPELIMFHLESTSYRGRTITFGALQEPVKALDTPLGRMPRLWSEVTGLRDGLRNLLKSGRKKKLPSVDV